MSSERTVKAFGEVSVGDHAQQLKGRKGIESDTTSSYKVKEKCLSSIHDKMAINSRQEPDNREGQPYQATEVIIECL